MKKSIFIVGTICILMVLTVGIVAATSMEINFSINEADRWALEQDALKDAQLNIKSQEIEVTQDLYHYSYSKATDEQKDQLEKIEREDFLGAVGIYTKQIKCIMNELPENIPNLSKEQVVEICSSIDNSKYDSISSFENDMVQMFNQIAGAPDFEGGSGISRYVYFLDDDHNKYIMICLGNIAYHDEQTGNREIIYSIYEER